MGSRRIGEIWGSQYESTIKKKVMSEADSMKVKIREAVKKRKASKFEPNEYYQTRCETQTSENDHLSFAKLPKNKKSQQAPTKGKFYIETERKHERQSSISKLKQKLFGMKKVISQKEREKPSNDGFEALLFYFPHFLLMHHYLIQSFVKRVHVDLFKGFLKKISPTYLDMQDQQNEHNQPAMRCLRISKSSGLETFPSPFLSIALMNWFTSSALTSLLRPKLLKASLMRLNISFPSKVPDLSWSYLLKIASMACLS